MSVPDAALDYIARGWSVLPIVRKTKAPATEHGKDDATNDESTVRDWFAQPGLNVGVHAGRSGIVVIDVDARTGGLDQCAALIEELGPLPDGPIADTGGGGVHRLFRAPVYDEIRYELRAKLRRGVDFIRGNNYIVTPPSVHPSGNLYLWRDGKSPSDLPLPDLPPAWLALALRERPQPQPARSSSRDYGGESVYDVLGQLDQKYVLECISGTWLVGGEVFAFKKNANGKHNLIVDGKERGNFVDADGKIGAPDTGHKDGGPLASTWLRWYRHSDARIREGLIEFVPELARWVEEDKRRREDRRTAPRDDVPHPAESVGSTESGLVRSLLVVDVARLETPPIRSYSTGNMQLDRLIGGGINTRELLVVMGPPGAGKTAWAIATSLRIQRVLPVLYASTELEQHELMARIAGNVLAKPWSAIRRGNVPRAETVEALDGIQIRLLGCDLLPRDGAAAVAIIEHEAKAIGKECGVPPLIVIDYLQDLARGAERDIRSRVGDHASSLRAMSQRLDCPLIGVSSVARTFYSAKKAAEFRELNDPTAYLAAAKESGDVDYAAARVLFLDVEDDREKPERDVRIAVAKSRDATTGFAGARMVGESGRWIDAPDVLGNFEATKAKETRNEDDDMTMLQRVQREAAAGRPGTLTEIRVGNGISKERAETALVRLRLAKRIRETEVVRQEGGRPRTRVVFVPVEGGSK